MSAAARTSSTWLMMPYDSTLLNITYSRNAGQSSVLSFQFSRRRRVSPQLSAQKMGLGTEDWGNFGFWIKFCIAPIIAPTACCQLPSVLPQPSSRFHLHLKPRSSLSSPPTTYDLPHTDYRLLTTFIFNNITAFNE